MMIPITRKEKYISEIVGGGNTAPETPQTREEIFFAGILGEVVAPSPITRAEKYLAKIANKYSGELPEPVTRIERFLARAAGMDVTIPTPITREEMLWNTYIYIPIKTIEGIPPLTFKAKKAGTLENYRIYGNTVDGESVGDRTGNLFDKDNMGNGIMNSYINSDGTTVPNQQQWIVTQYIPCNSNVITIKFDTGIGNYPAICLYDDNKNYITGAKYQNSATITVTTEYAAKYIRFSYTRLTDLSKIMLNSDSTALPYEPYGYKVPVTVSDGTDMQTTTIYLDAPLAKSGNNADYIDYATQKRRNSDGTESSVTLPEIAVTAGTNMLSVGTEVQPSNVYIKYEGER